MAKRNELDGDDPEEEPASRKRITHEMPIDVFNKLMEISRRDVRTVRQTINFILIRWLVEHEGFRWTGVEPPGETPEDSF